MNIPQDLRYSKEHEWVRVEGNIGTIGITDFAQSELGELVYIEIDSIGEELSKDDVFGTVEAVKTTSELFMPISGKVIEFNDELSEKGGDNPAIINEDPYGKGWIVKIEIADESELDDLLSPEQYTELIA
ncbi:MAG: glycine cleavage system protein GcvH [Saprospiraceae bacterium]|nr:glycine cleavage system protein GcvH [Saprospiraceae bacterium]